MTSVFDLFRIGIGPSSSHTVGPMRAGRMFVDGLGKRNLLARTTSVKVGFYGSLGSTGRGHGSDIGVMLGLMGELPDTVDPGMIDKKIADVRSTRRLILSGTRPVDFDPRIAVQFFRRALPQHPNGIVLTAFDAAQNSLIESTFFSVGGGFVTETIGADAPAESDLPFPFHSASELLSHCADSGRSIAEIMRANEATQRSDDEITRGLLHIWQVMQECVSRGCGINNEQASHSLAGPLGVARRAPALYRDLSLYSDQMPHDPLAAMDWVSLYAIAVNEENASGGRVVTAPTNGAAGIIPSTLHYFDRFYPHSTPTLICDFLLTCAAIGSLYKRNASISGAEVGCQGEVGVACSMAAAGLTAVLGGTPAQVENAAEIGMEHHLGMTCDPVGGRVQIPCIERNAVGAVKAIHAARIALRGDGRHVVSLDSVIRTMWQTGLDMKTKYKETSRGGLAVNVVEC